MGTARVAGSGASFRVAIAGNPNAGKTTLFNVLTGSSLKTANYPGVTTETRESALRLAPSHEEEEPLALIDLPGTYTLFGHTPDEKVAASAIAMARTKEGRIDAIVAVIDASRLERNLYLLTQLIDTGIPVVAAITKLDVAERQGVKIYSELMGRLLGISVVNVRPREGKGLEELNRAMIKAVKEGNASPRRFAWMAAHTELRETLRRLEDEMPEGFVPEDPSTKRLAALAALSEGTSNPSLRIRIEHEKERLRSFGIDAHTAEAAARFHYVKSILARASMHPAQKRDELTERIDRLATHRIWGTLIFILVMGGVFQAVFSLSIFPMHLIEHGVTAVGAFVTAQLPQGWVQSLLVNGVIAGSGSVLMFVPQIALLFLFISLLEESGYLARGSYLLDRFMSIVGLQGRCFIPLLNSFACAVPGMMSARVIPARFTRITTILIAPLMSCSARIPVYTVFIAAFIPARKLLPFVSLQGLTMLGLYLLGFLLAGGVALVMNRIVFRKSSSIFAMELPDYHRPSLCVVWGEVRNHVLAFVKLAGGAVVIFSVLWWFLATFPRAQSEDQVNLLEHTYAGMIGHIIEPAITPLGLDWETGVSLLSSFASREVFVSTLATLYNIQDGDESARSLVSILRGKQLSGAFPLSTALPLLVFFVIACQCTSTLVTCKHETNSWGWAAFLFVYTLVLAYGLAWGLRSIMLGVA